MTAKKLKLVFVFFLFFFLIGISYSLSTLTVTEGELVRIEPLAVDPDQDEISYQYFPPLNESGEWQTTLNDAGVYYTKIAASDGQSQTEEEVVIIVRNKNRPPEIEDKKIVAEETETIDLKGLISDPDNDSLKLIFEEPFDRDGVWQTDYDDAGNYQAKVIASDLDDKTIQIIEIEIKGKNCPPEIISSFSEDKLVQLTEDSTFPFSVSTQDYDGDELTYAWQLDGKEIALAEDFEHYFDFESSGEHELMLVISDQKSELKETWVLKIENLNRPPEIEVSDIIVGEGEKIVLQLPETDADGDLIAYTFQSPFQDGVWQTGYDDAGEHTALVTASDGNLTIEKEIKITINDVDLPPAINLEEEMVINEGEKLEINLSEFISDPDGDNLTIEIQNLPEDAIFSGDNSGDKLEWAPDYDFVKRESNFFTNLLNKLRIEKYFFFQDKEVSLPITACGKELCAEHILKIQVSNVNRKPLLEEITNITLMETETLLLEPKAADPDDDYVKYQFEEPFDSGGKWDAGYADEGEHIVTVTATDGELTDTKQVKITVLNKNRPPTLGTKKDYFELKENQAFSLKITAADPDEDELILWAENLPEGAAFKEQTFFWNPSFDALGKTEPGQFIVNFIVSDGEFDVVHPITIAVENVNRVPQMAGYSPAKELTVIVEEPVIFSAIADDSDEDDLTYKWSFGFWEKMVEGANTVKRTFKTPGMKTVKVEISDGISSMKQEWAVKVNPLPALPGLAPPQPEEAVEEKPEETVLEEPQAMPEIQPQPQQQPVCPKPTSCPETRPCPEPAPCLQPATPPQAPFKVYVVEG